MKKCKIKNCKIRYIARGYCTMHYQRFLKTGDALSAKSYPKNHDELEKKLGKKVFKKMYYAWSNIKSRTLNKNNTNYKDYGGRGIKISKKWIFSLEKFVEDVGLPPTLLHTVDRIDVNGDYKKTNVRWATRLQQANNQRMNGNRNQFNLIGVTQTHGKYFEARVKINGKLKYLGSFRTPLLAHRAYMRKKLEVIKSIDNGTI